MFTLLQNHKKKLAIALYTTFLFSLLQPSLSYALTTGPSQPEVQQFTPMGVSDLVDPFTGDFSYNIPLFELPGPNGGYPFNLAYQSGITMDQEASWVGLGWNLATGSISRQMRGIPDEFDGDPIVQTQDAKPSITLGISGELNTELGGQGIAWSPSLTISYNNQEGLSQSSLDLLSAQAETGLLGGVFNAQVDLERGRGISFSPSWTWRGETKEKVNFGGLTFGANLSTQQGLESLFLSGDFQKKKNDATARAAVGAGGGLLGGYAFTPSASPTARTINTTFTYKTGLNWEALFNNLQLRGFITQHKLVGRGTPRAIKSYGLMHMDKHKNAELLDFNREKDGVIYKGSPLLAPPHVTPDYFSIQGQGIGGTFTLTKNNVHIVGNAELSAVSDVNIGVGIDKSTGDYSGVNFDAAATSQKSNIWDEQKGNIAYLPFNNDTHLNENCDEPYAFKVKGELAGLPTSTAEMLNQDEPIGVKLEYPTQASGMLYGLPPHQAPYTLQATHIPTLRQNRNTLVTMLTNAQIKDKPALFWEYKVELEDNNGNAIPLDRSEEKRLHHPAGYVVQNTSGLRYLYALPVYNHKQIECSFSISPQGSCANFTPVPPGQNGLPNYKATDSEEHLMRKEIPAYAHSYMLTAIVGADYVDADDTPGPSQGDQGYWVKFTYKKTEDNYKWRAPYFGAQYNPGVFSRDDDDKASYTYGEKEVMYLSRAETKSHVAVFHSSARQDALGAVNELQNTGTSLAGAGNYNKLDKIELYTRPAYEANKPPLKTVAFEYDYSLCPGVPNRVGSGGKLTLKRVRFLHQGSTRGTLHPYTFTYSPENPAYSTEAYDRWGSYQPLGAPFASDFCQQRHFPYTYQGDDPTRSQRASAWHLTQIDLPSGGDIRVDYEQDDYAYVQDKVAMQMTPLTSLVNAPGSGQSLNKLSPKSTQGNSDWLKVYFPLENPIPMSPLIDEQKEVMRYVDTRDWQLYFKVKTACRKCEGSGSDSMEEYIGGYAKINKDPSSMGLHATGGNYTHGYVTLLPNELKGKKYHPIFLAAATYIKQMNPRVTTSYSHPSGGSLAQQIQGLIQSSITFEEMFKDYFNYTASKKWFSKLDLSHSYIRLNTPDRIKHGGGVRVKQLTFQDNWTEGEQSSYGQVYDYTTKGENGERISSGVAAYEPFIAKEENALYVAKHFTAKPSGSSLMNMLVEFPLNEMAQPSPTVGYSRVTVKSLATAQKAGEVNLPQFPGSQHFSTTGATVHEFYTAKDFPVVSQYTGKPKVKESPRLFGFIPFVKKDKIAMSQGFSTVLNDMHGKPKKTAHYPQHSNGDILWDKPTSWTKYHYKESQKDIRAADKGHLTRVLNNKCETLTHEPNNANPLKGETYLGLERTYIADFRYTKNSTKTVGRFNTNIFRVGNVFLGAIAVIPNVSISERRTAVINKITRKTGILERVEAFDGQAIATTKNILWDAQTGQVLLSTVTNNFEEPVFQYQIPAYMQYEGMQAAYQNIGLQFDLNLTVQAEPYYSDWWKNERAHQVYTYHADSLPCADKLFPGDHFLLSYTDDNNATHRGKAIFIKREGVRMYFFMDSESDPEALPPVAPFTNYGSWNNYTNRDPAPDPKYVHFYLYRSGYQNLQHQMAGSVTALKDPTTGRTNQNFSNSPLIPQTCP
jgi:hypothetical protein